MTAFAVTAASIPAARVRLFDERRRSLLQARLRVLLVCAGFAVVAFAAMLRIGYIGVVQPAPHARSMAEALLPPRGEITDRNGLSLARAFPAYALWFNPEALGASGSPLVKSPKEVARQLKAIFPDLDQYAVERQLAAGRSGYLRRRVLPEDANRVMEIGELGLELPRETDRHYPQGMLAAHVLGYVEDGKGKVGMEAALDDHLANPATRMHPTALSIDARVQGALEDELNRGMKLVDAVGAAGIVLDVDTGEVLAMASLPAFDPNKLDAAGRANVFNKVTNQVYELGSTFKPLTVAAAIDAGVVTDLSRRYDATSPFVVSGRPIRDSHYLGASLNVPEALIQSSNVVTAKVVDQLGAERLQRVMRDLGMMERPYIELPARGMPLWQKGQWPRISAMTVGYGHGISVTPLHLASAYATMVNGGIWRPATLKKVEPGHADRGRRVFKASTSARMNQLLRMIVTIGTGKSANAQGFRVGGKTGSAEKPGVGGYRRSTLVSTFASAFPMDRPRFVVIAMVDEPKGTAASSYQRTAAFTAAPIIGNLVPRIWPMLGVMPDDNRDIDLSDLKPLVGSGEGE